jgi:type VI protein secretion system component VasK
VPSNALAISPELAYLTRFTNPKLINGINHYFENLHNYLLKAKTLAGAYQLTKQRFLNDGASDPINNLLNLAGETSNPIRFWFYQIAQNSWQQLLISTQQFLQNKWGNLVWPTYYNQIVNRYPFSSHSMQYVSLNSFINFFEPSGVLQNYFSRYLRPFINTNKMPWKMLSLNGRSLNINNSILKSFEKLPELQKIFFPNNSSQLNIAFTLTPTQLSDNLANATLTLGNQIAKFAPYNTDAQPLTWPDAKNTQQLSLTFVNDNGVSKTLNFNNAWGLWQLFARSNLKQMTNSDSVKGFIIDGNDGVRFILKPQSKINPFNLKLFSGIQLNQKLAN